MPEEIHYLELRQYKRAIAQADPNSNKHGIDWPAIKAAFSDWKIILLILANWSQAVPNYALKFSMPTIIKGMGYTSANAQLLTIPPYACGAIASLGFSMIADRISWRMPFIVVPQICVVIGYAILFAKAAEIKQNIALCYFAVCVACFGYVKLAYALFPCELTSCQNVSDFAWRECMEYCQLCRSGEASNLYCFTHRDGQCWWRDR